MQSDSKRTCIVSDTGPLLVFISARAMRDTLAAINAEEMTTEMIRIPPENTELAVIRYSKDDTIFRATVIQDADTASVVAEKTTIICNELNHTARVMILIPTMMRNQIRDEQLPPSYYLIRNIPEFEECLGVHLNPDQHRRITRQVFQNRRHRVIQVPLIEILGALANAGMGIGHNPGPILEDVHVPETRTPLNEEWEKKIAALPESTTEGATCVICLTAEPTIMLAPCQHQCVCDVCIKEILERDSQAKKCPMCRAPITDIFHPIK